MIECRTSGDYLNQNLVTTHRALRLTIAWPLMLALGAYAGSARAAELYGDADTALRWDNTLKYSGGLRLEKPLPALIAGPNGDDGDRNFQPGLISNRVDLLSEMDVVFQGADALWGANASGAAWYDTVYNANTDATRTTPPGFYVLSGHFSPPVRNLHGRHAELLDAYAYVSSSIADVPFSVRAGRHTLLWGESLFFAGNGVAAGQAPIDTIKALSVPVTRAKEVYMPVAQISASVQPTPELSVSAYYQFEWRKSRLPGAGSYFSAADFLDAGGYRIYVGPNQYLSRGRDTPAPDSGQFGLALRATGGAFDYGVYALRFNAREPQRYLRPNPVPVVAADARVERPLAYGTAPGIFYGPSNPLKVLFPGGFGTASGIVGSYNLVYPEGIQVYGGSFSGYLGDGNLAGEVSLRRRMPLISTALVLLPGATADADTAHLYARGNTLHGQISYVASLPPGRLWDDASISSEIAATHRLNMNRNAAVLDTSRSRSAAIASAVFEPRYYAVLPGLDLSLPASVAYGFAGRSSVDGSQTKGTGSASLGMSATYRAVWPGSLSVTHFIGGPSKQPFTDRDFLSFSVQRTF